MEVILAIIAACQAGSGDFTGEVQKTQIKCRKELIKCVEGEVDRSLISRKSAIWKCLKKQ